MFRIINIIVALLLVSASALLSQSRDAFNYQAVVRDNGGNLIANQNVSFRISILKSTADGTSVYSETHTTTTSSQGIVALQIGNGSIVSGDFPAIQWGSDVYFTQIEVDTNGGEDFQLLGTTQLLSVPYALHAKTIDQENLIWLKNSSEAITYDGRVSLGPSTSNDHQLVVDQDFLGILFDRNNADFGNTNADIGISSNGGIPGLRMRVSADNGATFSDGIFITENANVGIGTTTPHYKLDVTGTVNASEYLINGQPLSTTGGLWTASGFDIAYIDGNVGIGTSSPEHKLEIVGDGTGFYNPLVIKNNASAPVINKVSSDVDYNHGGFSIHRSRGTLDAPVSVLPGDRIGGLYAGGYFDGEYHGSASVEVYVAEGAGTGSYSGNIRFMTTGDNETYREERMRISESGNIGIGTTAPKSKLQVSEGDIYLDQIGTGVIMKSPDGQCWKLTVDNSGSPAFQSIECPQ